MSSITVRVTVPITVDFEYQPYEPPERGPEAQHPGCAESIEITRIIYGPMDEEALKAVELAIWEALT